jgi:hypothetical protein
MIDFREVLIINDQPTTCPKCGARTDITLDLSHTKNQTQIHKCYNEDCNCQFMVEED